ncbi:DUF979 domain-containing protein [Rheinheimera mesophila]|uniref:DUF979 domain-containing protein n=1 Tax=Rheinheimera mesophila TaxID=1547515 RepID=A0A3P3QGZ7_9GAMM|nr:DUF979 domain-containing protein [Rheinheimera mesophila]KKL00650.1 permease [Rheinheimera mesophila]RRJ19710.1 DUF979 domain-containing protein [Rheinheimera mesophila]
MISMTLLYYIAALLFFAVAFFSFNDKRYSSALFWCSYGLIFLLGDLMPPALVGGLVVLMAFVAGFGGVKGGNYQTLALQQRLDSVKRLGNKLFIPALMIPGLTVFSALVLVHIQGDGWSLLDAKNATLSALGLAAFFAVLAALYLTKERPQQALKESSRLIEAIGWAFLLPQLLATLGLLFNQAGVGETVSQLTSLYLNLNHPLLAVACYALGMALFTVIMGNAFAAFPVITAGIGIPLLVLQHGGDPAIMAAIGMFCGYCGTLLTPMAANFNIVPAALLELPDKNAVIKAQAPTALLLLGVNIALMYLLMF